MTSKQVKKVNKPKKVDIKNPLFILVEGEGMCEVGMVDIQQQDDFDKEWEKIRLHNIKKFLQSLKHFKAKSLK